MSVPVSLVGAVSQLLAASLVQPKKLASCLTGPPVPVPKAGQAIVLDPTNAIEVMSKLRAQKVLARVAVLDPWYRAKTSPGRAAFVAEAVHLLAAAAEVAEHVFLWGFPEHIARVVDVWPRTLEYRAWLTWYFKNAPSRAKNWRPAQQACLHLSRPGAAMYPEHFYSPRHREMAAAERLEYKMTPYSVLESALLSGFIKKTEQTGHPAQKPESVIAPLLRMTMKPGDLVIDPTCGSGTTGAVALKLGARAILSDRSARSISVTRQRLAKISSSEAVRLLTR